MLSFSPVYLTLVRSQSDAPRDADGRRPGKFFTINGRAFPSTDVIKMKVFETLKVRFIGSSNGFIHPIHGGPFVVVARDGETLAPAARFKADTINVGPGQRYDVIWTALKPGKWMIHFHIGHHTTNNNTEEDGGGGLMNAYRGRGRSENLSFALLRRSSTQRRKPLFEMPFSRPTPRSRRLQRRRSVAGLRRAPPRASRQSML